jgi:hypothetical protein
MKKMRQAVPQNWMALDILIVTQGGTCAITKIECYVYIPENSDNISMVLQDIHIQINAMSQLQ